MYIVVKYKILLYSLPNRPEKLAKGSLFCLFLKLVQINFIFTDNVRILYISFSPKLMDYFIQGVRNKYLDIIIQHKNLSPLLLKQMLIKQITNVCTVQQNMEPNRARN